MLIIRDVFIAKPGMASKLAAQLKEAVGSHHKVRVMTDLVGQFNNVVMEFEVPNLGEYEKIMKEYMTSADLKVKMKGYTDLYMEGRREVYQVTA